MWRRIVFYSSATLVVLLAVLVTLFQLLSPYLNDHKKDFENWVSEWLHMPVHIGEVSAEWRSYYPVIVLQNVTIDNPSTKAPFLNAKQISAYISVPSSLWHWAITLNRFLIKGTRVEVYQNDQNEFILKGFPEFKTKQSSDSPLDDLINAFANQPALMLQDCYVLFTTKDKKQFNLKINDLQIANNNKKHEFIANVLLYQKTPTSLSIEATWVGTVFHLKDITGSLYFYAKNVSLAEWFSNYPYQGVSLADGLLNTKNWLNLNAGELVSLQTQFEITKAKIKDPKNNDFLFHELSGELSLEKKNDYWILNARDLFIESANFTWPKNAFTFIFTKNEAGLIPRELEIDYLNLKEIFSWRSLFPDLLKEAEADLIILNPVGELKEFKLNFSPDNHVFDTVSTKFVDLSVNELAPYPGFKAMTGSLKTNREKGELQLKAKNSYFSAQTYFSKPLLLDKVKGKISWEKTNNNEWMVTTDSLQFNNEASEVTANGLLTIPENGPSIIDLSANFNVYKAELVQAYLPDKIFSKPLTNWLRQAFLKGHLDNGKMKLQGVLNEFPFDKTGTFLITGDVKNVDFRYAPLWPIIQSIDGKITFSGRKILIESTNGKSMGVNIGKITAVIPYIGDDKDAILQLAGEPIPLDLAEGTRFLLNTPLKVTYGKILATLNPKGPALLNLGLNVPLSNPDNTLIKGDLSIDNGQVNLDKWRLKVSDLKGLLTFTEKEINAANIEGQLFKKPITLNINTVQKNNQANVAVNFLTQVNVADIEDWLKLKISDTAKGSALIKGNVSLSLTEPIVIGLDSDLEGVAVNLETPYRKAAAEKRPLHLDVIVSPKPPVKLRFIYDDNLSGALLINNNSKNQFNIDALTLLLGKGEAAFPSEKGLKITGFINQINWNEIENYLKNPSSGINLPLKGIDVRTNEFNIFNQHLKNLHLTGSLSNNHWDITLSSPTISGRLSLPKQFNRNEVINVQLDKLIMSSNAEGGKNIQFNLQNFPAILFNANYLQYDQLNLGRINFKTETLNNSVAIRDLTISSPNSKLKGSGYWSKRGGSNFTQLSGFATSSNVSALLKSFNFDVHNYILQKGQIKYNLNWYNAPYAPELKSMTGNVSLKIGKGRILEVTQTSGAKMDLGRMLSIFSLQTIPRRLSLDFSDVFQSGYTFDSFQGDFTFAKGSIHTSNTFFDGPVARINIVGDIGLINKDYHLTLGVTAYVTSSIPIAATLLTANPVVGVAAIAANRVLGSAISKVTTYYYNVTGPWSKPIWTPVSSGKAKKQ